MKKIIFTLVSIIFLAVLCPRSGGAVTVSAGPVVWYAWWNPMFKNALIQNYPDRLRYLNLLLNSMINRGEWKTSGAFLYGPAVSVKLSESWSLSSVFAVSGQYRQTGVSYIGTTTYYSRGDPVIRIRKYDLDTTVGYSPLKYLKVFGGFKYQGYSYKGKSYSVTYTLPNYVFPYQNRLKSGSDAYGAGLGLGATLPLFEDIYLLANVSGLYLRFGADLDHKTIGEPMIRQRYWQSYDAGGANGSLSFAWYIPAAAVTVSVGARFQVLRFYCRRVVCDYLESSTSAPFTSLPQKMFNDRLHAYMSRLTFDGTTDYFYGATFSVTYSFEI
jgi:hypothetical protein